VAGVVESAEERRLLEDATGGPVLICRLDASDAELALRIERRGREEGDDLVRLAARAAELSAQLAADGLSDFSVATGGRSTGEVAGEVLARWS
jgi:ribose 1,5-bisphosphokinase PhnN